MFSPTNHSVPISHVCLKGSKVTGCEVVLSPGHRHERPAEGAEIARLLGVSSVRPGAGPMGPAGQVRHSPLLYHLLLGNWATQHFLRILGSTLRAIQDSESQKCFNPNLPGVSFWETVSARRDPPVSFLGLIS